MADYPLTTVTGKIGPLLSKIREVGVPSKATVQWLKSVGFKSSNDSTLLTAIRFIGLIDQAGVPTETWKQYRGANHKQVLANAIRDGYKELYAVYPDAHARTSTEIEHVISTSSSAGKQAITKTVRTFQKLCEFADFSATGEPPPPETPSAGIHSPSATAANQQHAAIGQQPRPSLHIDIQVHISPEASPEQVDKIFESMAKHLYKNQK